MVPAAKRIARYNLRMQSALVDPVVSRVVSAAVANYTNFVLDFYPNQVQLRAILDAEGVSILDFAAYEAYHGELYHLVKTLDGPALRQAWIDLMAKWADAAHFNGGDSVTILQRIGAQIYSLELVGTP